MDRSSLRFELSTRTYLLLLVAGIVVPGIIFAAIVLWRFVETERAQYRATAVHAADRIAAAVDRELSEFQAALQTLATGRSFGELAFDRFYERAREVKRILNVDVLLKDESGQQLVNTRVPFGSALPVSLQPHERQALELRRASVSGLFVGTFSREPTISLTLPISRAGASPLLLTIAASPRHFLEVLRAQALPESWRVTLVDGAGTIIARSRDHERYLGRTIALSSAEATSPEDPTWRSTTVDGTPSLFAATQPQLSNGWRVIVSVPVATVNAPLYRTVIPLALGGGLTLLATLGVAIWLGRRASDAMAGLASNAAALGASRPISPIVTSVREINLIGAAMVGAARALEGRNVERASAERQLVRLNESLEAAVEERSAQLVQLQKLEAVGQLTGGVAHDFNNLLMAILGSLELMKKRIAGDVRAERYLDNATQAARRGATLTQRLLAFARRQDLELTAIEVPALSTGMSDLLRRSIGPKVQLDMAFPDDLPAVSADANQLELAVLNLAVNARDAMPRGGKLVVAARAITVEAEEQALGGLPAGIYVVLTLRDDGEGMSEETLRRAAEPFFTTKGVGRGTGLGLSMVHGLARQSGGKLVLESREGEGTAAHLWLPVAREARVQESRAAAPQAAARLMPHRILLVDDDPLVIASTSSLLEDLGQRVIEANSGARALEILRAGPPIDLMITDYAMPAMTGLELIAAARRDRPGLPIILATGYAEAPDDPSAYDVKLGKPFTQSGLAVAITHALDSERTIVAREPLRA